MPRKLRNASRETAKRRAANADGKFRSSVNDLGVKHNYSTSSLKETLSEMPDSGDDADFDTPANRPAGGGAWRSSADETQTNIPA